VESEGKRGREILENYCRKSHHLIRHHDTNPKALFPRGRPRTRVGRSKHACKEDQRDKSYLQC